MGHKALILIICDVCRKAVRFRHFVGNHRGDACSFDCARVLAAKEAE